MVFRNSYNIRRMNFNQTMHTDNIKWLSGSKPERYMECYLLEVMESSKRSSENVSLLQDRVGVARVSVLNS